MKERENGHIRKFSVVVEMNDYVYDLSYHG